MTELTLDQLRQKIGAGRQRRGLFTLADDEGRPTTDLTISGQPVLVVNLWSDGMARFYADISGSRLLANFNRPPYQVDEPQPVPAPSTEDILAQASAAFCRDYPHFGTADGARNQCKVAAARFCDALIAAGQPRHQVHVDEIAIVAGILHYGAVMATNEGPVIIDVSARQFRSDAPWPLVLRHGAGERWDVVPQSRDLAADVPTPTTDIPVP